MKLQKINNLLRVFGLYLVVEYNTDNPKPGDIKLYFLTVKEWNRRTTK